MIQMYRLQDLQLSDTTLKQQYYTEFFGGNISTAQNIVNNNPQLSNKVLNASNLNNLVNNILSLENEFNDNVNGELSIDLLDFNLSIDEFIYTTTFNNAIQYEVNNVVDYNGDLYYCKVKPPMGTLPTNQTYWLYIGLKGVKGDYSLGVNYKGAWSSTIQYTLNDMIVYKNVVYISKTTNSQKIPSDNTSDWFKACIINLQGIYVSRLGSQVAQENDLWLETNWKWDRDVEQYFWTNENLISTPNIGDLLLQLNGYTNTQHSGLYISKTRPITNLSVGDIWLELPNWDILTEQGLKAIYINTKYPYDAQEGSIWIELLY